MRILNSEYFFLIGFNWIQLDSIGWNWIEKTAFSIQNFELNSIHNAQKKLILFLD